MRHKKDIRKLSRTKSHRKALIRNMSISFFKHEQIKTTQAKAKELRRTVEKLITVGKKGDLASLRAINAVLNHTQSLSRVREIADKYKDRNGGYTQIIKMASRKGDSAEMVIIKLV